MRDGAIRHLSFILSAEYRTMSTTHQMIVLDRIAKSFQRRGHQAVTALEDVSLAIRPSEIYGIIGRSGAGKSTLIRLINGLEKPSSGKVLVDGVDIAGLDDRALRWERRKIGMIFQHFNLLSSRSVFDNVALPLELARVPRAAIDRKVTALLGLVGLADKRRRYPAELSGGQKQRVGIARALATDPKILLSDEATSALDPETTASILALLAQVNTELGVTIVLITHQMAVIKDICHRVGVIEAGRIIEEGSVYDVFAHPKTPTAQSFVGSITRHALPKDLAARLQPEPTGASQAILRLTFTGSGAEAPILSRLARERNLDVAILHGQIDTIAGRPFGILIVAAPAAAIADQSAQRFLAANDVATEVLGYVA